METSLSVSGEITRPTSFGGDDARTALPTCWSARQRRGWLGPTSAGARHRRNLTLEAGWDCSTSPLSGQVIGSEMEPLSRADSELTVATRSPFGAPGGLATRQPGRPEPCRWLRPRSTLVCRIAGPEVYLGPVIMQRFSYSSLWRKTVTPWRTLVAELTAPTCQIFARMGYDTSLVPTGVVTCEPVSRSSAAPSPADLEMTLGRSRGGRTREVPLSRSKQALTVRRGQRSFQTSTTAVRRPSSRPAHSSAAPPRTAR